jgi:hypothetical protein
MENPSKYSRYGGSHQCMLIVAQGNPMPSLYLYSPPRGRSALETQDVYSNPNPQATSFIPNYSVPQHSTPQFSLQAFSVSTPSASNLSALASFASTSRAPTSSAPLPSQQQHHSQQHTTQQASSRQQSSRQPPVSTPSAPTPATRPAPARQPPVPECSRPTVCEPTPTPADPMLSKKSFRKLMSNSIGKSFRSLSNLFEGMKVADQAEALKEASEEAEDKTVSEAMEETTLFLNGFSRTSAFKPGVDEAILKELDDVQAKYKKEQTVEDVPRRRGRSGRPPVQSFYGT